MPEVEMRKVADLTPHERNSRTHSAKQIKQIAESIKTWGFTSPLIVDEEGTVLAGHGRLMAAQKLRRKEVPCRVVTGWSEEQKRAYVIADNKLAENAGWDVNLRNLEVMDLSDGDFGWEVMGFSEAEFNLMAVADAEPEGETEKVEFEAANTRCVLGELSFKVSRAEYDGLIARFREQGVFDKEAQSNALRRIIFS